MKRIYIDQELCQACKNCVLACMVEHSEAKSVLELDLTDPTNQARNKVVLNHDGQVIPLICRHCDDAVCLETCMSGALQRDEQTGHISCNEEQCAGCWMCVMSCPYGMVFPGVKNNKVASKCDMCTGKEEPACVANCPTGAIKVIEVEYNQEEVLR